MFYIVSVLYSAFVLFLTFFAYSRAWGPTDESVVRNRTHYHWVYFGGRQPGSVVPGTVRQSPGSYGRGGGGGFRGGGK